MIKLKKIIIVATILLIIIMCTSCDNGLQIINIEGLGSFKVPNSWIYTEEDGIVYFTDKPIDDEDCSIYLIEPMVSNGYVSNKLFGKAGYTKTITYKTLSNSANYGSRNYLQDDNSYKRYFILFIGVDRGLLLIAWDDLVEEDTIKEIAESYVLED